MSLRIILYAALCLALGGTSLAADNDMNSPVTGDVIEAFPTPGTCPTGLAYDGSSLWLADLKTDLLYQIDPQSAEVRKTLPAPTFRPIGLAFDGDALWCVCGEEERLYKINPDDGQVLKTFESPVQRSTGLAWDGKYLWVASRSTAELHQISPRDGTTITSFKSPNRYPCGLAFDGGYLWVADRIRDRIYMVHPERGEVVLMFDSPSPYAYGLAWDGKNLWNADFQSDSLYCIAIGVGENYSRKDPRKMRIEFTHEVRNYGPGTVNALEVYLAVPHDYLNQTLLSEPIFDPQPTGFLSDRWGQKVANHRYENAGAGTIVKTAMTAEVELWDTWFYIFPEKTGDLSDIPKDIREKYLVNDEKFDFDNPVIQKILKEDVGDETNPYWIMRKIYGAVIDRMYYELSGGWNTAPAVLVRGNGSCSEYTFVFIALCRAAGVPARYTGSIAIRGDDASLDDVFHRWAEVYLPNYGWVPVDPSRGDDPLPEDQAEAIGHWGNKYIITTWGGGNSEYLGWTYNASEEWTSSGKCKIYTEHIGEWNPLPQDEE